MSAESDPNPATHEPLRAFLLAQALEACIQAERRENGSSEGILARQPAWARAELRRLLALTEELEAASQQAVMSEEFRVGARARLMRRISAGSALEAHLGEARNGHAVVKAGSLSMLPSARPPRRRRGRRWVWRGGLGGLLAAALVTGATLTASANALPGEPLYTVKQAGEEIRIRLAPDDQSRALALLAQANARLDETARLLDAGRTDQAEQTTQAFDDVLNRATTTYVVTITGSADESGTRPMESELTEQQSELQNLLQTAPEPARADLRQALVATERSRALVSDPQPVDNAVDRTSRRTSAAAAVPTVAAESLATDVPAVAEVHAPPPVDLLEQPRAPEQTPAVVASNSEDGDASVERRVATAPPAPVTQSVNRGPSRPATPVLTRSNRGPRVEDAQAPVVADANSDDGDHRGGGLHDDGGPVQATNPRADVAAAQPDVEDRGGSSGEDQNQNDSHGRIAQQPTAVVVAPQQPTVVVASGNSEGHGDGAAAPVVQAATSGRNPSTPTATAHDGGGTPRPASGQDSAQNGNSNANAPSGGGNATNGGGNANGNGNGNANPPSGGGNTTNANTKNANANGNGNGNGNGNANPLSGGNATNANGNAPSGGGNATNASGNGTGNGNGSLPSGGGNATNASGNAPSGGGNATNASGNGNAASSSASGNADGGGGGGGGGGGSSSRGDNNNGNGSRDTSSNTNNGGANGGGGGNNNNNHGH